MQYLHHSAQDMLVGAKSRSEDVEELNHKKVAHLYFFPPPDFFLLVPNWIQETFSRSHMLSLCYHVQQVAIIESFCL